MSQPTSKPSQAQAARQREATMLPAVAGRVQVDDSAYRRNLPCLNPNCHSHGQPHPNCRCYGMAEGGLVGGCHCCKMAEGGLTPSMAQPMQPEPSQDLEMAFKQAIPEGLEEPTTAAIAHGGANMLFGHSKAPFVSAFGSGGSRLQALVPEADELKTNMTNYASKVNKGHKSLDNAVRDLFGLTSYDHEPVSPKDAEHIKDYVKEDRITKDLESQVSQMFAEGGDVGQGKRQDPLTSALPTHNLMLNMAKARVVNHLNANKPSELKQGLTFDAHRPDKNKERAYDHVVNMAAKPLSILKQVKEGSLTPSSLQHFTSMYPELQQEMGKRMTREIVKAQLENRRPSYKVRQAMSLFLGAPLDSTMTQTSIAAAQNTFAQKAQQQQAQPSSKKDSALSKVSKAYETDEQASETRKRK